MVEIPSRLADAVADRYRILRPVGEGGMASVYLAEDLKHHRRVALKVLKPELAAVVGGERFIAEIRTTANLQHPHILPLFDSGETAGLLWFAMPYVEGESLQARLDREKQLPVEEAVQIAMKVAGALQTAHDRGIVHRDIKPGNILLGERGEPLVSDFGIALAVQEAGGGRLTETGLSLGTPHYMSPEQATADRDLDARSDVYSLACVLYQMLTGEPPFTGGTAQAILGRILTSDPRPPSEVRRSTPPNVDAAVLHALEKTPADRPASAEAFADALRNADFRRTAAGSAVRPAPSGGVPAGVSRSRVGPLLPWATAAVMALVAAWGWGVRSGPGTNTRPAHLTLDLPVEGPQDTVIRNAQISPDGGTILLGSGPGSPLPLRVRGIDDPTWRPLPGTVGAKGLAAFSPQGDRIAYTSEDDALMVVPVAGGTPRTIVPGGDDPLYEPFWGDDDVLVFARETGLYRVPASGGPVESYLTGKSVGYPFGLPGSGKVLVELVDDRAVAVFDPALDSARVVLREAQSPVYLASGHILFSHPEGGLRAVAFDADRGEVMSDPVTVLENVPARRWSITGDGTLLFSMRFTDRFQGVPTQIVVLGQDGSPEDTLPLPAGVMASVRASPDGEWLAYFGSGGPGRAELNLYDLARRAGPTTITLQGEFQGTATWSPDGDSVALSLFTGATDAVQVIPVDGGEARRLAPAPGLDLVTDWTADGLLVGSHVRVGSSQEDLFVRPAAGQDSLRILVETPFDEDAPRVSPNGGWVVFGSNESGQPALHVRTFPDGLRPAQITRGIGTAPVWSPDGRRIYFARTVPGLPDDTLMVVDFDPVGPSASAPRPLIALDYWGHDVLPDGRLVVVEGVSEEALAADRGVEESVVVIVNWLEAVRDILPD